MAATDSDPPVGTLDAVCLSAISLVDTITVAKQWGTGDGRAEVLLSHFNRDFSHLRKLSEDYKAAVAAMYPVTGLEIDGRIGTCAAAIAHDIAWKLYWTILPKSGSEAVSLALETIHRDYTEHVPVDCKMTAAHWADVQKALGDVSDGTLTRLGIALRRELATIAGRAQQQLVGQLAAGIAEAVMQRTSPPQDDPPKTGGNSRVLVEQQMEDLTKLHGINVVLEWTAPSWSELIGCDESAIRHTEAWKRMREMKRKSKLLAVNRAKQPDRKRESRRAAD